MTAVYKPSKLVAAWFVVAGVVVLWDASYILARPHSLPGGKWHTLWKPYAKYAEVDYCYGFPAWEENDGFPPAQSIVNLFEVALGFAYAALSFGASATLGSQVLGALCGIVSATSTVSKTVLYFTTEYLGGLKYVGHNSWTDLVFFYIVPSSVWIIFPLLSLIEICTGLYRALAPAVAAAKKVQ
ncbi:uncharacterized protein V1510DRAFT_429574 [Dipodascopsis tothii]|uniref:uncharacterized protein n=1 Tax=Dipodascopsis tothii TaxID=44089 RepID=UPI0034CF2ECD